MGGLQDFAYAAGIAAPSTRRQEIVPGLKAVGLAFGVTTANLRLLQRLAKLCDAGLGGTLRLYSLSDLALNSAEVYFGCLEFGR